METLHLVRKEIDLIDMKIVELLIRRDVHVSGILQEKILSGAPTFDPEREKSQMAELVRKGTEFGLPEATVIEVFSTIIESSRAHQELRRGNTVKVPIRSGTFCTHCDWTTAGDPGPPGSTKRICASCKRPLTIQSPGTHSGNRAP